MTSVAGDAELITLARAGESAAGSQTEDAQGASGGEGRGPAADPPAGPTTRDMLAGMLGALLTKARARFPSLAQVWTPDDVTVFCDAAAPLLDKYGMTPDWLKAWEVEIRAALVCGPLILATVIAVRADLESERARAAKDAGAGKTASASAAGATEAPGTVKPAPTGE